MRRSLPGTLLVLAVLPGAARAQAAAAIQPLFNGGKNNLIKSAELMPEAKYSFKPVATVRTFGELIGHLANENYLMCAAAKGDKNPAESKDFEKTTAKADLVKALRESLAYCDDAYQMPNAKAMEEIELFGMKGSRLSALTLNVVHNGEHYGNLVTYLRMNGLVPPSSQQSSM